MKPRYWTKLPRQDFEETRKRKLKYGGWTNDLQKKIRQIERAYAPGYTSEPYIQLVEETEDRMRVIAEWSPHQNGWLGPLQAAGLADTPGDFK